MVERILEDPYDLEAADEVVEYCSALEMIVTAIFSRAEHRSIWMIFSQRDSFPI